MLGKVVPQVVFVNGQEVAFHFFRVDYLAQPGYPGNPET
jgi:hypothetical protein